MNFSEGLGRIAFSISAFAWLLLILGTGGAISIPIFGSDGISGMVPVFLIGLGGFVIFQGAAWIISGFISGEQVRYGVWWPRRRKRLLAESAPAGALPPLQSQSHLVGVGGWLAFFILTLGVFSPLRAVIQIADAIKQTEAANPVLLRIPEWSTYKSASWLIGTVAVALLISAAYRLWKLHRPASVSFAILAIWIAGPGAVLTDLAVATWLFGYFTPDNEFFRGAAQTGVYSIVWTLYLKLSRRVKNTYVNPGAWLSERPRIEPQSHS